MNEKGRVKYAEERRILRKAMLEKKLIVFVGSGTSLDSGMPSWGEAVKMIANRLNISENNMDYMKIPQFYYNARGKKEYVELMREIFRYNDELKVSDVHRNIIKLNTHTIITTNYDCLLEQAATENTEFIQLISQDKDLPYRSAEKELIKMHGDFLCDNFVLREDDYLHYSENFKLIETYIKSLIATNVVLFVGYSFSDPDVKQIFSWVKDILEDDFQRAYMLEVIKEFDAHEQEYYKNLGINVIYASEMHDDFDKKNASTYTNDFLKYILEEDGYENRIDEIYERCKAYSCLNYVCRKYINKIFQPCGIIINNDKLESIDCEGEDGNKLLSTIFCPEDNTKEEKNSLIKEIVYKSAVNRVVICRDKKLISVDCIDKKTNMKLVELVEKFDFESLKKIREDNEINLNETVPELYLEQAYISYVLFDYVKSYRYLRRCSKLFYSKKQYVWYFISEVNRKNVGRIIEQDVWVECSEAERKKIKEEVKLLDVEKIYRKLPFEKPEAQEFLQDLYTFRTYYTLFQETYLTSKKTEKEAKTSYSIYAGTPGYVKLRTQIQDCYFYDLFNYIMIDRYQEDAETYQLFARTMIDSVCSIDLSNSDMNSNQILNTGNIYANRLEKFDVYIILRYMQRDELARLLREKCNGLIEITEEVNDYLHNIVKNIAQVKNIECQYFWIYLTLAGYMKLDDKLVIETVQSIYDLTNDFYVRGHYEEIARFFFNAYKQHLFKNEDCMGGLTDVIEKLISGVSRADISVKYRYLELLKQCLAINKEVKEPYYSETLRLLAVSTEYDVLAKIYPFCNETIQNEIKHSIEGWKWGDDYQQVNTYESLVMNCDVEANENIEKFILDNLEELKIKCQRAFPSQYEQVIGSITNLYLNDKICMKEEIKEEIKKSGFEFYKWLVEMDEFDYEQFNILWLNRCSSGLLKTIAKFPNVKKGIAHKMKEAYLNGNANQDILKRYFEYFVDE